MSIHPTPTILIPALPPKTFIGINLVTFTSTANFHGIRDLPPGWHFLYSGSTETLSLRSGGWFSVGGGGAAAGAGAGAGGKLALTRAESAPAPEVFIWKWDSDTETLVPLKGDNDAERQEVLRHKANLGVVWQAGGLFRFRSRVTPQTQPHTQTQNEQGQEEKEEEEEREDEGRRNWTDLTCYLSPSLLSRITGEPEVDADARPRWMVTSASTAQEDSDDIPGLASSNPTPGTETRPCASTVAKEDRDFTFLPVELKRTWREGATGRERTEAAQDRSWALGDLIKRYSNTDMNEKEGELQVLGELQFTFLMALTLLNFSCLQQWKRLLQLILTCRSAIAEREGFMRDVIRLLLLQLQRCDDLEGGLFAIDADEGGESLQGWLVKFAKAVDEIVLAGTGAGSAVKTELDKLGAWVKDEYEWELHPEGIVRRGMLRLEDGEEVEMDVPDDEDEETGEYAATVVDLEERF